MPPEVDEFGNPIQDLDGGAAPTQTDKAGSISSGVKSKLMETANSAMERLKSVVSSLNGMSTDDNAKGTPSSLAQEIKAIASTLSGVLERYPSPHSAMTGDKGDDADKGAEPPKDEQKKEGLEAIADAVEKAAGGDLSKKDKKALRKIMVDLRKVIDRVDPEAKEALKQYDIVLKSIEDDADPVLESNQALVEALNKSNELMEKLGTSFASFQQKLGEQDAKIAKMDRTIPPANSRSDDPEPAHQEPAKHEDCWDM